MGNCDANIRHQNFKRNLRAYHDSINRKNRYNLARIAGKLDLFEAIDKNVEEENVEKDYEVDRKIPNTDLTVLKRGDLFALGDLSGNRITDFKYQFIEGCLGEHDKIVRCVTDDGKMEDFSVELKRIVEDACAGGQVSGIGVGDMQSSSGDNYHEIDYTDVREQLNIPYLCGARVIDIHKRNRKRKRNRRN